MATDKDNNAKELGIVRRRQLKALIANTTAVEDNKRSLAEQVNSFGKYLNVTQQLTQVYKTAEALQIQSLALGTTYNQFSKKNTKAIQGNNSTQQEMTQAMLGAFGKGLRNLSDETVSLADHMIVTGQSLDGMYTALGNVRLLTGDSIKVTKQLSKTLVKTNETYGVSTGDLVNALNAAQQAMEEASVYGTDAVGAFGKMIIQLKGAAGGAAGSDRQISIFMNMADALNIGQQQQLGIYEIMKDLRDGNNVDLRRISDAANKLDIKMGEGHIQRRSLMEGWGRQGVLSFLYLGKMIEADLSLGKDEKKKKDADRDTVAQYERNIKEFYNTWAPGIYDALNSFYPMIATLAAAVGARKLMGAAQVGARAGGIMGGIGAIGLKAIPIIGTIATIGFGIAALAQATAGSTKATKKATAIAAKEQRDKESSRLSPQSVKWSADIASRITGGTAADAKKTRDAIRANTRALQRNNALLLEGKGIPE